MGGMMYTVHVPKGVTPRQVDDFPAGCERSTKGAVHFRANSTATITEGEYKHVLEVHSDFGRRLLVVRKVAPKTVAKAAPAKAETSAKKPEAKAEETPPKSKTVESDSDGKKTKAG